MKYGVVVNRGRLTTLPSPFARPAPSHTARYLRTCDEFVTAWNRSGFPPFVEPAEVLAALARVVGGAERFPKPLFLAARRFQRARP